MTKKDFILIADKLKDVLLDPSPANRYRTTVPKADVIDALCQAFKESNLAFKEDRWREYLADRCGPNGGKR